MFVNVIGTFYFGNISKCSKIYNMRLKCKNIHTFSALDIFLKKELNIYLNWKALISTVYTIFQEKINFIEHYSKCKEKQTTFHLRI